MTPTPLPTPLPSSSRLPVGGRHHQPTGSLQAALATLRDIPGISGSFLCTNHGDVVARNIDHMLDDVVLGDVAERLSRIQETFAAVRDQLDFAVIRFRDHKLYLKTLPGGMLCILADRDVNMAALRMASNLVVRRVTPELQRINTSPASPAVAAEAPVVTPAPTSASPPLAHPAVQTRITPVTAPGTRRFRGRPVE